MYIGKNIQPDTPTIYNPYAISNPYREYVDIGDSLFITEDSQRIWINLKRTKNKAKRKAQRAARRLNR